MTLPPVPTLASLKPGDIMFARHVRPWPADILILGGQTFLGQPGYPHHVGVVVQGGYGKDWDEVHRPPRMVQAMPSGAEEVDLDDRYWTPGYVYIRPNWGGPLAGTSARQFGLDVAAAARKYVGTKYGFLDYVALGLHKVRNRGYVRPEDRTALERYVATSKRMICSQLADQAMTDAGWHTFTDGRLPQDVTPGALYERMMDKTPAAVFRPGKAGEYAS